MENCPKCEDVSRTGIKSGEGASVNHNREDVLVDYGAGPGLGNNGPWAYLHYHVDDREPFQRGHRR